MRLEAVVGVAFLIVLFACRDDELDTDEAAHAACLCPPGETCCDDICVDLQNDEENCGSCGADCTQHGHQPGCCQSGVCVAPGTTTDPTHCGLCGVDCTEGGRNAGCCIDGECVDEYYCECAEEGESCDGCSCCPGYRCVVDTFDLSHKFCARCWPDGSSCDHDVDCCSGTCVEGRCAQTTRDGGCPPPR